MTRAAESSTITSTPTGLAPALCLRLLGPVEVRLFDTPLSPRRSRKETLLLAALALHPGQEIDRRWLAATFWPESRETVALANLRSTLKDLRRALGEAAELIRAPRSRSLQLHPNDVECDVAVFDALLARGDPEALARAVPLYRGPFLDGYTDVWVFQERQRREQAFLHAIETLADRSLVTGDPMGVVAYLRRTIATDPLRESAYRLLMCALAAEGNHAAAHPRCARVPGSTATCASCSTARSTPTPIRKPWRCFIAFARRSENRLALGQGTA